MVWGLFGYTIYTAYMAWSFFLTRSSGGPSSQLGATYERQLVLLHYRVAGFHRDAQARDLNGFISIDVRMGRPGADLTPERLNRDAWWQRLGRRWLRLAIL